MTKEAFINQSQEKMRQAASGRLKKHIEDEDNLKEFEDDLCTRVICR